MFRQDVINIIGTFSSLFTFWFGFSVWRQSSNEKVLRNFLQFTVGIGLWGLTMIMALSFFDNLDITLVLVRLHMSAAVFLCFSFLLFALAAGNIVLQKSTKMMFYVVSACIFLACFSEIIFKEISNGLTIPQVHPGKGMPLFAIFTFSCVALGCAILTRGWLKRDEFNRFQLKIITISAAILFLLINIFSFFIVLVFHNTFFLPLAPIFLLPSVIAMSYSISRYGLGSAGLTLRRDALATLVICLELVVIFYFSGFLDS